MAKRKNITVIRRAKVELNPLTQPYTERGGMSARIPDPLPARTPLNVYPKIDGTPESAKAQTGFTTPFNLTPKVADVQE